MSKRLAFLVVTCLTAGLIYSFGCGGGGGDQPPPPPQTIDKVVWAQEVPLDFELAVPVPAPEGEEQKAGKAFDYTAEEEEQGKAVAFFVSNPDGTDAVRLTPKKMSAVQLGEGLAPNGDLWFATKAGIFATNVSDPKPRLIMSLQDLAMQFSDATEPGLYYPEQLIGALNDHILDISSVSDTIPNEPVFYGFTDKRIRFFPKNVEGTEYVAFFIANVKVIKASSGEPRNSKVILRYDSSTGEVTYPFPFLTAVDDYVEQGIYSFYVNFKDGDNLGNATIYLSSTNENYVLYSIQFPTKSFYIMYDPASNKHTMFDMPWYFDEKFEKPTYSSFLYYKPDNCAPYQEGVDSIAKQEDCKVTFTTEGQLESRKKAAACMQNALNGKKIAIKCALARDVTDLVSSKDKLAGFLSLASPGEAKKMVEFDAGIAKSYEYREEKGSASDIECASNYCQPKSSQIGKKVITKFPYLSDPGLPYLLISGNVKDGNELRNAFYLADLATGEFKMFDKEDSKTKLTGFWVTKTADGVLFIYTKTPITFQDPYPVASEFSAYYAYDPSWPAPVAITKNIPNYTEAFQFTEFANGKKIESSVVTYDRKYAFIRAVDDMQKKNTYMLDLTNVFPQKVVAGEEQKTAKAEGETITNQAINPFGENAKMINPVLQSQNISAVLKAKFGDKLIWTGNQDGFERLYWNTLENPTFNRFTLQDIENNEEVIDFAQNLPAFVLPSFAVPFDISADLATELACGKDNLKATYCADARQMCRNKACVDMYSCSADAPKGACYKSTDECQEGVCVAKTCTNNSQCGAGEACVEGVCKLSDCVASCVGKSCGDDGCNGSCGTCPLGKMCEQGKCVAQCTPKCAGKQCGPDDCGGQCGACMLPMTCNELQQCAVPACTQHSDCANGICKFTSNPPYQCTTTAELYVWKTGVFANTGCPADYQGAKFDIDIAWIFQSSDKAIAGYDVTICRPNNVMCQTATKPVSAKTHLISKYGICWKIGDPQQSDRIIKVIRKFSDSTKDEQKKTITLKYSELANGVEN